MPGDLNSSIGYLDVQFGALDIMLDGNTFDADTKFGATNSTNLDNTTTVPSSTLDLNSSTQQNSALDPYSSTKPTTQSSISSAISQGVSAFYCSSITVQCYDYYYLSASSCPRLTKIKITVLITKLTNTSKYRISINDSCKQVLMEIID